MSESSFNWSPIRAGQLRVGHFIRIDHPWFDHPFVRGTFRISTQREIDTILQANLTRISVDWGRSGVQAEPAQVPDDAPDAASTTALHSAQLLERKIAVSRQQQSFRDSISEARARYLFMADERHALLARFNAGDAGCYDAVKAQVDGIVRLLAGPEAPLGLIDAAVPLQGNRRLAMRSNDATSLCAAIGKLMGLSPQYTSLLLSAAALHVVGLQTLHEPLKDEAPGDCHASDTLRAYPETGAQLLASCGASDEVVRIVREHRERPDGQGFPAGLKGDEIHPLATLISAVREYQVRCSAPGGSPARALAYMYRNMRGVYGEELICRLVAAVSVFPPGTTVLLSDGSIGRVLRVNPGKRMRPVVGILAAGARSEDLEIVDLARDGISIERALDPASLPPELAQGARNAWLGLALMPQSRADRSTQASAAA